MNETPTKRSSLSSRASKIPQKIQSSFFSLKPSASTLPNDTKLSTRITHMLFRPKSQLNNDSNISLVVEEEVIKRRDSSIILFNNENDVTNTPYSSPNHQQQQDVKDIPILNHDSTFSSTFDMNIHQYAQSLFQKCTVTKDMDDIISHTQSLINACNDPAHTNLVEPLYKQLDAIRQSHSQFKHDDLKLQDLVNEIKLIGETCLTLSKETPCLCEPDIEGFTKELPKLNTVEHKLVDQLDLDTCTWFRHYFVGKPYHTFIGPLNHPSPLPLLEPTSGPKRRNSKSFIHSFLNNSPQSSLDVQDHIGIISVIEERVTENTNQYRIIIRSKQTFLARYIVHESMVKETIAQLESKGESFKLDHTSLQQKSRSFMRQQTTCFNTMMQRAAILTVCPDADVRLYKELSAESTILAGLEKDLLKYDEIHIPKHYKFGLLTIKDNQTTEEAWFANTGLSDDLKDFLNLMGHQIELNGYTGYSAGLDTKSGESGEYAYVSKWNNFDIMFHTAPLMPSQKNDRQQVLRKKHIGNDIVCIIFLEGHQLFNPNAIRSQFLHVYIIIRPEIINSTRCWRVEVVRKSNVSEFGPSIPSPSIFYDNDTLKQFLTIKLMNAENAALKSEKFSVPNKKARLGLFATHIQTGLSFQLSPTRSRSTTSRNKSSASMKHLKLDEEQQEPLPRPKSIHVHKSSTTSRLLREALLDEEKRKQRNNQKEPVPPIPYLSKSTMLLQDFKNGIVSSSKKIIGAGDSRKSTQVKITTNNGTKTTISLKQENPDKPWRSNGVMKTNEPIKPLRSPSRTASTRPKVAANTFQKPQTESKVPSPSKTKSKMSSNQSPSTTESKTTVTSSKKTAETAPSESKTTRSLKSEHSKSTLNRSLKSENSNVSINRPTEASLSRAHKSDSNTTLSRSLKSEKSNSTFTSTRSSNPSSSKTSLNRVPDTKAPRASTPTKTTSTRIAVSTSSSRIATPTARTTSNIVPTRPTRSSKPTPTPTRSSSLRSSKHAKISTCAPPPNNLLSSTTTTAAISTSHSTSWRS